MPSFNDPSWDCSILTLGGLFYCGRQTDNNRRNAILRLFSEIQTGLSKLRVDQHTPHIKGKIGEWNTYLTRIDASPITYEKAVEVERTLEEIAQHLESVLNSARAQAANKNRPPSSSSSSSSSSSGSSSDEEEYDLTALLGDHHAVTTKPRIASKAPPLTLHQLSVRQWSNRQHTMATDCDNVVPQLNPASRVGDGWGQHAVDRAAIEALLPVLPSPLQWVQGQVAGKAHVRVFAAFENNAPVYTVWADGLTHASTRNAGDMEIYQRTGNSDGFSHAGGRKHAEDYP